MLGGDAFTPQSPLLVMEEVGADAVGVEGLEQFALLRSERLQFLGYRVEVC